MGIIMNTVARAAHYVTGFIFSNDSWFYRISYSHIGTCIIEWKDNTLFPKYFTIDSVLENIAFIDPDDWPIMQHMFKKRVSIFFVFTSNNRTKSGFIFSKSESFDPSVLNE